jgi:glycosyltransferase involved in cell wall biosynthesis
MRYFRDALGRRYRETLVLASAALPEALASENGFERFFGFYYAAFFPFVDCDEPDDPRETSPQRWFPDRLEAAATVDAERLLETYDVGPDDHILYPHADFYGVLGLLNALLAMPPDRRPTVFLRMIGVMETATHGYRSPLDEFCLRLGLALEAGLPLYFSAETPRYADEIAVAIGAPVTVTAYPEMSDLLPLPMSGPFVFYCAGSARFDKGFNDLLPIFTEVRQRDRDMNIRFVTQILADHELETQMATLAQLYAVPGVELQPASISAETMVETYCRSHAVLLPYDTDIYRLRGSAVLMEALCHGRPAITYDGSAFAELVRHYGLGKVVPNHTAMVDAIMEMAQSDRDMLERRARQARHRFLCDNAAAFETWMNA